MVLCGYCQAENQSERKFCVGCGELLWEPCLACGTVCGSAEAFCGSCGVNLSVVLKQCREAAEQGCAEADELTREHDYAAALHRLEEIKHLSDPRLAAAAARVEEVRSRIRRGQAASSAMLDLAIQQAEACLAERDMEGIEQALADLPEPVLDERAAKLLRDARNCLLEVATLTTAIEEGLASPRGHDVETLLSKAERLLRLRPDDERFLELKRRLQDLQVRTHQSKKTRLLAAAKEHVDRFDYAGALAQLDQLPMTALTPDVEKQVALLKELAWLKWDVQNAPVIDATLLGIAQKLAKAKPDDRQTVQTVATLEMRARGAAPDRRRAAPAWVKPPESTAVGCPVDWVAGFRRLLGPGLDKDVCRMNPGCFYVAAGLALQGLGAVPVRLNLLRKKAGWLGLGGKEQSGGDVAWGLDVSSSGIKAMRLAWDKGRQQVIVEDCGLVEFAKPLCRSEVETQWRDVMREALQAFLAQHDLRGAKVCAAFSRPRVLGRFFRLPPVDSKKRIQELISYETKQQIPFPLDELSWDYATLVEAQDRGNSSDKDESWESLRVVLIAAKRDALEERLALCREVGLKVHIVQSDAAALHNFFAYDYFGGEEGADAGEDDALVVFDLGCDTTHVLISTRRSAWFRSANFGSDDMTAALARARQLTFTQAETVKRNPLEGGPMHRFDEATKAVREELLAEIQRTLQTYLKVHPEVRLRQMYAVGGGMRVHGLLRHLRIGQ